MQKEAVVVTNEELYEQRKIIDEQRQKQQAKALAKKKRMIMLEEEKKRTAPELNDLELEEQEKRVTLKAKAQEQMNEQLDEVKYMNQMVNYAKCVTVRDKQLIEKQRILQQKIEEEKRLDLMMEVERLRKIKEAEETQAVKKVEVKKGRDVIIDQMKERELKRLKFKQEQAKEAMAMVRHMKQMEDDSKKEIMKKKSIQKRMLDEIYDANQQAAEKKHLIIQREKDEIDKIMKFQMEKAQKEAELAAEAK